jgi:hypothetical protein
MINISYLSLFIGIRIALNMIVNPICRSSLFYIAAISQFFCVTGTDKRLPSWLFISILWQTDRVLVVAYTWLKFVLSIRFRVGDFFIKQTHIAFCKYSQGLF